MKRFLTLTYQDNSSQRIEILDKEIVSIMTESEIAKVLRHFSHIPFEDRYCMNYDRPNKFNGLWRCLNNFIEIVSNEEAYLIIDNKKAELIEIKGNGWVPYFRDYITERRRGEELTTKDG